MATGYLLPIGALFQGFSDQGVVASGYKINTYVGGSVSTPVTTYTDSTLTTPNANPVVLGSNGRFASLNLWVPAGTSVKLVMTDANNNVITGGTIDNVVGVNDPTGVVVTATAIGTALYPQNAAELASSISPTQISQQAFWATRYGADPTGATDSSTAINNAITAAGYVIGAALPSTGSGSLVSGEVYLPPGIYLCNSTIHLTEGVRLRGSSRSSAIIKYTGTGVAVQMGDTTTVNTTPLKANVILQDVGVYPTQSLSSTTGVQMINTIRQCAVRGCAVWGFGKNLALSNNNSYQIQIADSFLHDAVVNNIYAEFPNTLFFENLRCDGAGADNIVIDGSTSANSPLDLVFRNVVVQGAQNHGVKLIDCTSASFYDCDMEGNSIAGVALLFTGSVGGATSGTLTSSTVPNGVYNATFSDGEIRSVTVTGTAATWTGALAAGSITQAVAGYSHIKTQQGAQARTMTNLRIFGGFYSTGVQTVTTKNHANVIDVSNCTNVLVVGPQSGAGGTTNYMSGLALASTVTNAQIFNAYWGGCINTVYAAGGSATQILWQDESGRFLIGDGRTATLGTYLDLQHASGNQSLANINNTSNTASSVALQMKVGNDSNATNDAGRYLAYWLNSSGANAFRVRGDGNTYNANNIFAAISDEKLKTDIADASSQWADVKALRVRKFRFKANPEGQLQIGLIAQEAELVSPGLVDDEADYEVDDRGVREATGTTTKTLKYSVLHLKALKALQEAMDRIEVLEAKIAGRQEDKP